MTVKIAVVVGSNRKDSINLNAKALAKLGDDRAQFNFIQIDKLPMFNQDLEANPPQEVTDFARAVNENNAVLFVTPEYNRSIPALLKNAIDWGSRSVGNGAWRKPIAVTGATPGAVGTAAVQQHLRAVMADIGGGIAPGSAFLTYKEGMFDDAHNITNEDTKKFLQGFLDKALTAFEKLSA